jgi:sulfur carrier protein ThiS
VQEKVDGSNVGVAKINGQIVPLTRAGYRAETSPFKQHHLFASWVLNPERYERFNGLLNEGERVCGEWLAQAHGTRYNLLHEPFVTFDLMTGTERIPWPEFKIRVLPFFIIPNTIHEGSPLNIENAMELLKISGHGAIDPVEGAVWRVERYIQKKRDSKDRVRIVDFLAKYVRPDKKDGIYLPEVSGEEPVWNWQPKTF